MRDIDENEIEYESTLPFRYKFLIFMLVSIMVVIGIIALLETKFKVKAINVVGNTWYTSDEITNALQTNYFDKYSVFFKLHYMLGKEPDMPFVDKITIKFESMDTISVSVYEKNIVGCVFEMGDYLYFDKDGFIISSRSSQMNNIPRIEGLEYVSLTIGKQLEVSDNSVFNTIMNVTQLIDKYKVAIDTIEFDENLNITLYCTDKNVVYLGMKKSYDEILMALPNVLAAAEEKTATYKIDMSTFSSSNTTIKAEFIDNDLDEMIGPGTDPTASPTPEAGGMDEVYDEDYDDEYYDEDYDEDEYYSEEDEY